VAVGDLIVEDRVVGDFVPIDLLEGTHISEMSLVGYDGMMTRV